MDIKTNCDFRGLIDYFSKGERRAGVLFVQCWDELPTTLCKPKACIDLLKWENL